MQSEILQVLEQKLAEAVRVVDEQTGAEVRRVWGTVNPSPACPAASDVMKQINQICHRGLVERGEKALDVTVSTLRGFQKFLDDKLSNQVMEVLARHFPEDQYVTLAKNTRGVYTRRQAPPQKFIESVYELEVAAISVGSTNLSRRATSNIRTLINELRLKKIADLPTRWERVKTFILHQMVLPVMGWVFGIIAVIIAAVVIYLLGISNG